MMEKAFQRMASFFGNQVLAKWEGLDMQMVYGEWADELSRCSLGQIRHGIELSKREKHPPNLGEFAELCRKYKASDVVKLEHKITPEQLEKNKRRIAEIAASLAKRKEA